MIKETPPVRSVDAVDRRTGERRSATDRPTRRQDGREDDGGQDGRPTRLRETVEPAIPAEATNPLDPAAAFAAQVIGQSGQKRGLRGGPPVLDAARSTYLGAEYSGGKDRRPRAGRVAKTEV